MVISLIAGTAFLAGAVPALLTHSSAAPPLGPSVHGTNGMMYPASHLAPDVPAARAAHSWPAASSGVAALAAALPARLAGRAARGQAVDRAAVPGTPAFVQPASATGEGPTRVAVTVAGHALSQRLGVTGVVLSAASRQGAGKVTVGLRYRSFAGAYGGNFGSRLRLVELPACALTTPQDGRCQEQTAVPAAVNWAGEQAVAATITLPASGAAVVLAATTTTYTTKGADGGSDGGGAAGSYAATTLKASGSWTAGGSTGDFTYSYPVTVPPAPSAMTPSLTLTYDSGSLDGQTAATEAQAGWLGDGWSTPDSFIEQSYVPCSDSPENAAATTSTSDECYDGQVLSMSLDGMSTSIVYDSTAKKYVLQDDNGDTVTKVTGSGNGSGTHDTSYWVITDRSGTSYYFGRNELPGWASGDATTNSVDSEPVFSGHNPATAPPSGDPAYTDPCWNATWAISVCTLAYRWHLDYVTDVHGNAMAWYYHQDTNAYLQNATKSYTTEPNANATYVRDSYPVRVDYGFTAGNAYSVDGGHAPDQVLFSVDDSAGSGVNGGNAYGRCDTANGTCAAISTANAGYPSAPYIYPDVPYDLNCASGHACLVSGPSFWSTAQLAGITTQQWTGTAYAAVDKWSFAQSFPATGDGTSPTLFLASISHTGEDTSAGGAAASVKNVTFSSPATTRLGNRVNPTSAFPELTRQRIATITTETGSVVTVNYELASACTAADQATPASNTGSCFPVWWTPVGQSVQKDWFNRYQVASVTQADPYGGNATLYTGYTYVGGAAWHYDDNEVVQAKYRTYGQFRGFGDVITTSGQGSDTPTQSEATYYRGMSDDNNSTAVTLTDSQGGTHDDTNQLSGDTLETTSYDYTASSSGAISYTPAASTIDSYWVSAAAASRTRLGLPALTANMTGKVETWTRTALHSGTTTTWRDTETDTSYDTGVSDAHFGLPIYTYAHGDLSLAGDSQVRCTVNTYEPPSATGNIAGLLAQTETVAEPCGGTSPAGHSAPAFGQVNALAAPAAPAGQSAVVSDTCTVYDSQAAAQAWAQGTATTTTCPIAAPAKGDVSEVLKASGYSAGSGFTWSPKSAAVYDSLGRVTAAYDALGRETQTQYTANTAGLTIKVTTVNPLGQSSSVIRDPERGLTTGTSDLNDVTSTFNYDGLGRVTAEWTQGRATSGLANARFTYDVSNTAPSSVTTSVLNDSGTYAVSTVIYDSLLRTRQTQSPTPQGGRLVTDTFYDSRGLQVKVNSSWWDSANAPSGSLATVTTGGVAGPIPDSQVPDQTTTAYDGLGRAVLVTSKDDGTVKSQTASSYDQAAAYLAGGATVTDGAETISAPLNGSGQTYSGAPVTGTVTDAAGRTVQLDQYTTLPSVTVTTTGTTPVTTAVTIPAASGTAQATDYGFDNAGNQVTVTDEATASGTPQTWTSAYNLLGQVTSRQDPDSGTSSGMTYDFNGNLLQSTNALGKTISTTYDALNRKTAEFDAATTAQSGSNEIASWSYDNANGAVQGMTDPVGQLTTATSYVGGTGGSAYTTQAAGFNPFGESGGETVTIPASAGALAGSYQYGHTYYGISGDPDTDTYPGGGTLPAETVTHNYGIANGLHLANGLAGTDSYSANVNWTAWSQPSVQELGSSTASANITSTYDPHTGALTDAQLKNTAAGSLVLDDTSYSYDPAGNPTSQTETRNGTQSETQCFAYDTLDRLRQAWTATDSCAADPSANSGATVGDGVPAGAYWTNWTFTPLGQRATETDHGLSGAASATTTYAYNGNGGGQPDTLTSTTTASGGTTTGSAAFAYDPAGNATSRSTTTGTTTSAEALTWNADGTLGCVTPGTTTAPAPGACTAASSSYVYDASGNLLLQQDAAAGGQDAVTTLYLPGEQLTLDTKTGAVTGDRFLALPGGGQVVRTGADTTSGAPGYYFTLSDQHGTATLQVGPGLTAATATWRQFTPYGAPRGTTVTWASNRGFLNKPADTTTSLTSIGARWYDPLTATFQSIDPLFQATSPQQHNGYTYAAGNPITGSDPTGLTACRTCSPASGPPITPASSNPAPTRSNPAPGVVCSPVECYDTSSAKGTVNVQSPQAPKHGNGCPALGHPIPFGSGPEGPAGEACAIAHEEGLAQNQGSNPLTFNNIWRPTRFVINLGISNVALRISEESGASCSFDSEYWVYNCYYDPTTRWFSHGRPFTAGSVIMFPGSESDQAKFEMNYGGMSGFYSHETKHSDQMALFTPFVFIPSYIVIQQIYPDQKNIFEQWAGLYDGGYTGWHPPEQG